MWFSRIWFFSLIVLTSVLISGALNTSSNQERGERSAHEVSLQAERHALQLSVESVELASLPEVIIALSTQYERERGQQERFDELFENWLIEHPLAVDVMMLNPGLSKDCPPGGGECSYRPLRPWNQIVSVTEVIETLGLKPLKPKETFVPKWGWVGTKPQLVVALPVTKHKTLGVIVIAGQFLEEIVSQSLADVENKWGNALESYSLFLGQNLLSGKGTKSPSSLLSPQQVTISNDTKGSNLLNQLKYLLSKGLAANAVFTTLSLLILGLLSSLLFSRASKAKVVSPIVSQPQGSLTESVEENTPSQQEEESFEVNEIELPVEPDEFEISSESVRTKTVHEDEWNNPNSLLPMPVGAESLHYSDEPQELGASSEDDQLFDDQFVDEELEDDFADFVDNVLFVEGDELESGTEVQSSELSTEDSLPESSQEEGDHEPNNDLLATDAVDDNIEALIEDMVISDEPTTSSPIDLDTDTSDYLGDIDDLVEEEFVEESDLVAELGQMFEDELGDLFDQLESPEEAAQKGGWGVQPQAVKVVTESKAVSQQSAHSQPHGNQNNEATSTVNPRANQHEDYNVFEQGLVDELSVIEDIDMHSLSDQHAEPEFTLDTNRFFSHLGLDLPTSQPQQVEVVHSMAPQSQILEDDLEFDDLSVSLDEANDEINFDDLLAETEFANTEDPAVVNSGDEANPSSSEETESEVFDPIHDDLDSLIFNDLDEKSSGDTNGNLSAPSSSTEIGEEQIEEIGEEQIEGTSKAQAVEDKDKPYLDLDEIDFSKDQSLDDLLSLDVPEPESIEQEASDLDPLFSPIPSEVSNSQFNDLDDVDRLTDYIDERGLPSLPPNSAKPTTLVPALVSPDKIEGTFEIEQSNEAAPSDEELNALENFFQNEYADDWVDLPSSAPKDLESIVPSTEQQMEAEEATIKDSNLAPMNDLMGIFGEEDPEVINAVKQPTPVDYKDELPSEIQEPSLLKNFQEILAAEQTEVTPPHQLNFAASSAMSEDSLDDLEVTLPPEMSYLEEAEAAPENQVIPSETEAAEPAIIEESNPNNLSPVQESPLTVPPTEVMPDDFVAETLPPNQQSDEPSQPSETESPEKELVESVATRGPQQIIDWDQRAQERRQARLDHYKETFQSYCTLKREIETTAKLPSFSEFVVQLNDARQKYIDKKGCPDVRFSIYTNKRGRAAIKARAYVPEV